VRFAVALVALAACHADDGGAVVVDPVFPADYADPRSAPTYLARDAEFPDGTLFVKEQYDFGDPDCTGPIVQWTTALKTTEASTDQLGFRWQRVSAARAVVSEDDARCYGCHSNCIDPTMNGYLYTCSQPP
jgi:hypothetical protein